MMEKPIIFNSEMVLTILEGRKTQTRRVMKTPPPEDMTVDAICVEWYVPSIIDKDGYEDAGDEIFGAYDVYGEWGAKCPYGAPGDKLWVRETWNVLNSDGCTPRGISPQPDRVVYQANGGDQYPFWRPSIFMPRWASRIQLRITNVRVERVRDISVEDAYAEGVRNPFYGRGTVGGDFSVVNVMFPELWDSINAKRGHSWQSNPWVWVIEFEKVKPEC